MISYCLDSRSMRRIFRSLLAACSILVLVPAATAAEALKKNFDLPAGDAAKTLKTFSEQSGEQIVYPVEQVRGVKTNPVKGELDARAALDRMLADTGLAVVEDEKTGALTVRKVSDPNAPRVAPTDSGHPEKTEKVESGKVVLEKYEITARKIDGLNNKGLLQAGSNAALYHDVVTRQDIERMGVSSIQELFRYMPQTSSATTSLQGPASNPATTGGLRNETSTVGLRGFSSSQTVVLVNGRALPRSSFGSDGGADIDRIPLAAIERVEVLPYSGSAIYGAGAIGGAINVILRKEYSGQDLTTYIGTSTDGGATEYRFTYLDGLSFNQGRTNLTLTLNYQHRDPLRASQRGYLDEALARYGPDSTAVGADGQRLFETLILPAFAGAPATILAQTLSANLGIPGAPGVRYAAIPGGTTYEQSLVLTPGSFTGTAGKPTLQPRYGRSVLYEPADVYSANAQLEHEFVKDKLTGYGEFTLGYNEKSYSMPQGL